MMKNKSKPISPRLSWLKGTALIGLASLVIAGSVSAQDVGEKMPKPKSDFIQAGYFDGGLLAMYENTIEGYRVCNGVIDERPFAFYDRKTETLYLDNNPTDGIVDEVVKDAGLRNPLVDIPSCTDEAGLHENQKGI